MDQQNNGNNDGIKHESFRAMSQSATDLFLVRLDWICALLSGRSNLALVSSKESNRKNKTDTFTVSQSTPLVFLVAVCITKGNSFPQF